MVSSRLRTTIVFFALCGLVATGAFAGNLTLNSTNYAYEIAKPTTTTAGTAVTTKNQVYTMDIGRLAGQTFVMTWTLSGGAVFAANPLVPAPGNPTLGIGGSSPTAVPFTIGTTGAATTLTYTLRSGGVGSNSIAFDVNVNSDMLYAAATPPTLTLTGIKIIFPSGMSAGGAITITAGLVDLYNLQTLDGAIGTNSLTRNIAVLQPAVSFSTTANEPNAVIDTTNSSVQPLTTFLVANGDALYAATAGLTIVTPTTAMDATGGTPYALTYTSATVSDKVSIVITGDLKDITSVTLDAPAGATTTLGGAVTSAVIAGTGSSATATFTLLANYGPSYTVGTVTTAYPLNGTNHVIYFNKAVGTSLYPRSFNIAATSIPAAGNGPSLALTNGTAVSGNWFTWVQNGTTIWAPYVNLTSANLTKFRFVNGGSSDVTVQYTVKLDETGATATTNTTYPTLTVPANGILQVTMNTTPDSTQGEIGPLVTAVTPATGLAASTVTRAKVNFIALGTTTNIAGQTLLWSPTGVITVYNMPQSPSW